MWLGLKWRCCNPNDSDDLLQVDTKGGDRICRHADTSHPSLLVKPFLNETPKGSVFVSSGKKNRHFHVTAHTATSFMMCVRPCSRPKYSFEREQHNAVVVWRLCNATLCLISHIAFVWMQTDGCFYCYLLCQLEQNFFLWTENKKN